MHPQGSSFARNLVKCPKLDGRRQHSVADLGLSANIVQQASMHPRTAAVLPLRLDAQGERLD